LNIVLACFILILGLALLVVGADILVRAAASLARRVGVSEFVVGVTVVAFGTSAPELFASVGAVLQGQPDLAVGNVVGSNIANILLILGAGGVIAPIAMQRRVRTTEIPVMAGITALSTALLLDQSLGRVEGAFLMAGLVAYVFYTVRAGAVDPRVDLPAQAGTLWIAALLAVGGIAALGIGTRAVVLGAVTIAERVGVPEGIIGLTVVAFGTSLPELAATVRAAIARKSDIAVGNIVGSNIFNLLSVLGVSAMVVPITVGPAMNWHIYAMGAVTALLTAFALARPVIGRWIGLVFLAAYLVYVTLAYQP
jgi:cation:H+ antiporter